MTVEFPSTFKPHSFSNVVQGAIYHKLLNGWIYFLKENLLLFHIHFPKIQVETLHSIATQNRYLFPTFMYLHSNFPPIFSPKKTDFFMCLGSKNFFFEIFFKSSYATFQCGRYNVKKI